MMMRYIALCALLASPVAANEAPPVPEGGLQFIWQAPCTDDESGEKGFCYLGKTKDGKTYLTFWQDDILMFIREVVGDSYITIWVNDRFNSI